MTTTAPRTPDTADIFECNNGANEGARLANDIAIQAMGLKKTAYDEAVAERDRVETSLN